MNGQNAYSPEDSGYYSEYVKSNTRLARRAYSRCALALVLYQVITYAVVFVAQFLIILIMGEERAKDLFSNEYVFWLFQVVPMYVVAFPCFYLMIKNMKVMRELNGKMKFADLLITLFAAHGVMQVGNYIGLWLNSFISDLIGRDVINSTSELIDNTSTWITILVVVIIGPIIEELMFRKLMIDRLAPYGTVGAIIFSSVTFGLFHGNFFQLFYAAFLGAVLGYVYAKTGKVRYTVILHMVLNFFGTVVAMKIIELAEYASKYFNLESTSEELIKAFHCINVSSAYITLNFLFAIIGIIILCVALIKRYVTVENKRIYRVDAPNLALASVLNLGSILFIIGAIVLFALEIQAK